MISDRLKKVIFAELRLKDFDLQDDTSATSVPGWDSLSHVAILMAIESEYQIRLRPLEVVRLKTVGDLQTLVTKKTQV